MSRWRARFVPRRGTGAGQRRLARLARRGIKVDRHKVDLPDPLKALGTYKVAIKVYPGMTPEVTIVVEPKG
jgi:large subunit ribosomal protein L9